MRFEGKMVKKPWGLEYCAYDDGTVAVWYLHLREGERTSLHYHQKKTTVLIPLAGKSVVKDRQEQIGGWLLGGCTIKPNGEHLTAALSDCWLMEIESPSDKLDLVRVQDAYGRGGKPYENGEHIIDFDQRYAYPSTEFPS